MCSPSEFSDRQPRKTRTPNPRKFRVPKKINVHPHRKSKPTSRSTLGQFRTRDTGQPADSQAAAQAISPGARSPRGRIPSIPSRTERTREPATALAWVIQTDCDNTATNERRQADYNVTTQHVKLFLWIVLDRCRAM